MNVKGEGEEREPVCQWLKGTKVKSRGMKSCSRMNEQLFLLPHLLNIYYNFFFMLKVSQKFGSSAIRIQGIIIVKTLYFSLYLKSISH